MFLKTLHDNANHYGRYLSLILLFDLNVHVIICGTSSVIFYLKHMFPNPVVLLTYPHLSTFYRPICHDVVVRIFVLKESQTLSGVQDSENKQHCKCWC